MKVLRVTVPEPEVSFQSWMEEKDFTLVLNHSDPTLVPFSVTAHIDTPEAYFFTQKYGQEVPLGIGDLTGVGITEDWAIRGLVAKLNTLRPKLRWIAPSSANTPGVEEVPKMFYEEE